ncbi:MAG: hypothetical protein IKR27_07440, partial [Lachnospiraceae bacterium]|nr:hypothetical protein [Lachnospiraceae bacterium]
GLQGIDNDSSFGALYKATGYKGTKVGPDSMSVIPASLAKKIMALDPDEFKLMLYGYDLSDPEADKAAERLTSLQDSIKASQEFYKANDVSEGILTNGIPRVVDDDKLADYDIEKQLSIFKSTTDKNGKTSIEAGNLFGIMVGGASVELNIRRARKNNIGIVDSLSSSITQTSAELGKLSEKMDDINGWYHLGSTQFDDMLKNCRTTSEYMRNFDKALIKPIKEYDSKTKPSEKDYELTDEAKKYLEMLKQSLSITEKYINERSMKNKDVINQKKGSAGWKRYQFALENKDILTKQLALIDKAEKAMADNKELTAKAPELIAWETEKNNEFKLKQDKWAARNNDVVRFNNALEKVRDKIEKDRKDNHLIDMVNGKFRYAALRGMRACEETENRGKDIKDDPEQYEIYKKGLAASLIRKKIELTNLSMKNNDKNIPGLAELKDIDITNAGNPDKCIEDVMKTERFTKLLQNPPKFTMKDCMEQASGSKEADMKLTDTVVNAFVQAKPKAEAKKAL